MILSLYNKILPLLLAAARSVAPFQPKIRRGLLGRKEISGQNRKHYSRRITGKRVLIHVASFGELEQAKPVISALRRKWPDIHIHLTFFSPSGYENALGKYHDVDIITYLPIDTVSEVNHFLAIVNPEIALFTKYDVWPNLARELKRRNIPTILFSASANEASSRWMPIVKELNRAVYRMLDRILVIDPSDKAHFQRLGIAADNMRVTGDTRFDQVLTRKHLLEETPRPILPQAIVSRIEEKGTFVFVVGSAWPEDETVIQKTLKLSLQRADNLLTIIVPHEPTEGHLKKLERTYGSNIIRFSQLERYRREPIIVLDSIGKLFGLYQFADAALIGGGFSDGVHNVLEAAVWSVPTMVGPRHQRSQEVAKLIDLVGTFEVRNAAEFDFAFWQIVKNDHLRTIAAENSSKFVQDNAGATQRIVEEIVPYLDAQRLRPSAAQERS